MEFLSIPHFRIPLGFVTVIVKFIFFQFLILGYTTGCASTAALRQCLSIPHFRIPERLLNIRTHHADIFQFLILGYQAAITGLYLAKSSNFQFLILGYVRGTVIDEPMFTSFNSSF